MKKNYTFHISGMTCHSCEALITMDLEDAGFTPSRVAHDPGICEMEIEESDVERVRSIIDATNKYKVTNVTATCP